MTGSFEYQPTLRGANVTVRPIEPDDWDSMFDVASDPRVWEQHPVSNRYLEAEFRQYFEDSLATGSAFSFVDNASGRVIGSSRYFGFDPEKSEVEIGWTFLGRDYWGGAWNREIKQLMLDHALQFVDIVVFWVGESNYRSRRAMEKIGGVLRDGVHTRALSGDDPYVVFEIRRENW